MDGISEEIDKKNYVVDVLTVFIDLSMPFDIINYILIKKLKHMESEVSF